jgi:DNA-binding MarR family transcriptional regulator
MAAHSRAAHYGRDSVHRSVHLAGEFGLKNMSHSGAYRHNDPDTAQEAAESIDVTKLESAVLSALGKSVSGLTVYEIAERLDISLVSASPRLRPLVRKGFVEDSGDRRETPSGRRAIVWRLVT